MKKLSLVNLKWNMQKGKTGHLLYSGIRALWYGLVVCWYWIIRMYCCLFPLKRKVIASAFYGESYADNTRYIIEKLHEMEPDLELIWLANKHVMYTVPAYVKKVYAWPQGCIIRRFYEYSTAQVILTTNMIDGCFKKRKGQLFIETWHGGLGIKKVGMDSPYSVSPRDKAVTKNTADNADIFISNSGFLTQVYKSAFRRTENIWECGYPKNDKLAKKNVGDISVARIAVRSHFQLNNRCKVIVYAPTFRERFLDQGDMDTSCYLRNSNVVLNAFKKMFKDENCVFLFRLHPSIAELLKGYGMEINENTFDATHYPDMQELIMGSDAFISDYSSGIFDAALMELPCFTYANDFEEYTKERGVYFTMDELPFPYAKTEQELCGHILAFDAESYKKAWQDFCRKVRLCETGHASEDIANYILKYI